MLVDQRVEQGSASQNKGENVKATQNCTLSSSIFKSRIACQLYVVKIVVVCTTALIRQM